MKRGRAYRAQIVAGGLSVLTAVVVLLGFVVAHVATSTRFSAGVVLAGITIAGTLIGGFIAAPYLHRLARDVGTSGQDRDSF